MTLCHVTCHMIAFTYLSIVQEIKKETKIKLKKIDKNKIQNKYKYKSLSVL